MVRRVSFETGGAKEGLPLILPIVLFFVIFMLLYVVFHISVHEAAVLIFPTIYWALTGWPHSAERRCSG